MSLYNHLIHLGINTRGVRSRSRFKRALRKGRFYKSSSIGSYFYRNRKRGVSSSKR